jgi:hypothetical protein
MENKTENGKELTFDELEQVLQERWQGRAADVECSRECEGIAAVRGSVLERIYHERRSRWRATR